MSLSLEITHFNCSNVTNIDFARKTTKVSIVFGFLFIIIPFA